jgi:glycosyltransferase involved in cell wall biosynthesis
VDDVAPFWRQASALAVPLLSGGGVRVKILEAMAMGVPVISTSIGCEGLAVQDRVHLLIADTSSAFAAACAQVLYNSRLAHELAENARQLVLERYEKKVVLSSLAATYRRMENKQPIP